MYYIRQVKFLNDKILIALKNVEKDQWEVKLVETHVELLVLLDFDYSYIISFLLVLVFIFI